jgi:hypothetical protein
MSNDVRLDTFPSSRTEALTMLYLQNKNLQGISPSELTELYFDAYAEIKQATIEARKQRR